MGVEDTTGSTPPGGVGPEETGGKNVESKKVNGVILEGKKLDFVVDRFTMRVKAIQEATRKISPNSDSVILDLPEELEYTEAGLPEMMMLAGATREQLMTTGRGSSSMPEHSYFLPVGGFGGKTIYYHPGAEEVTMLNPDEEKVLEPVEIKD